MAAIEDLNKDLSTSPPVDANSYFQKEGLLPAAPPKTIQIPEAAQMMAPASLAPTGPAKPNMADPVTQVTKGAGEGVMDLLQGAWNGGIDAVNGIARFAADHSLGAGDLISDSNKVDWTKTAKPGDATLQQVARGLVHYGAPMAGLMASGVGGVTAIAAGAGLDFMVLDPHQERLSNLVQEHYPEMKNIAVLGSAVNYLADHTNESDFEGRFKNALEAAGVGGLMEGAVKTFQGALKAGTKVAKYMDATKAAKAAPGAAEAAVASAESGAIPIANLDNHPIFSDSKVLEGTDLPNPSHSDNVEFASRITQQMDPKDLQYVPRDKESITADLHGILADPKRQEAIYAKAKKGEPLTGAEIEYGKYMRNRMIDSVIETAKKAAVDGSPESLAALADATHNMSVINAVRDQSSSISGADLNMQKMYKNFVDGATVSQVTAEKTTGIKAEIIKRMTEMSGGAETTQDLAQKIAKIAEMSPDEAGAHLNKMTMMARGNVKKLQDMATYWTINSMLSSLHTFVKVGVGNAYTTGMAAVNHGVAAILPEALGGSAEFGIKEAGHFMRGQMDAFMESMHGLGRAIGTSDKPADGVLKYSVHFNEKNPFFAENVGLNPESLMGKMFDKFGQAVSVPGQLAGAHDSFFGNMVYRGKLFEQAHTAAEGLQGEAHAAAIQKFLKDPPAEAHELATKAAQEGTFMGAFKDNALGRAGQKGQQWIYDHVPMGEIVMPFMKVGFNIADYTYQHSPLKGLAAAVSPQIRASMGAAGSSERALAMAKIYQGSFTMAGLSYLASQGLVTGDEPKNYQVKNALAESNVGWQPNSFKLGDTYISFKGVEPLMQFARMGHLASEASNYMTRGEYAQFAPIFAGALAEAFTPEQMVENSSKLMDAVNGIYNPEKDGYATQQMATDLAMRPVPAILRDAKNAIDPYSRSTAAGSSGFNGAYEKLVNTVKARIPWFSESLPVNRNIFGEPILVSSVTPKADVESWQDRAMSTISPFAMSQGQKSEVHDAMNALAQYYTERSPMDEGLSKLQVSMPSRTFSMGGVRMPLEPHEYEKLVMYTAGLDTDGKALDGPTLRDQMEEMAVPVHQALKEGSLDRQSYNLAVGQVSKVLAQAKKRGRAMMLQDPEFNMRWTKAVNAAQQKVGSTNVME